MVHYNNVLLVTKEYFMKSIQGRLEGVGNIASPKKSNHNRFIRLKF